MDLYSQGQSIIQANQLTETAREANLAAKDFNNTLAAQLDEANDELDAAASENQAINMFKGVTSGGKLVGLAVGSKTAKEAAAAAKSKLKKATTLVPNAVKGGGDIKSADDLRRAASTLGQGVDEIGPERFAAGTDIKAITEEAGVLRNREGFVVGVPTPQLLEETEVSRAAAGLNESIEGAASTDRAARSGIQTSAGTVGEAVIEDSRNADRVAAESGIWRDLGGPGAKAAKGATEAALDTALQGGAKLGAEQFAKTGIAGVGAGLDIYKDIQNGWKFDNWKQEVGNIGNIVGSALEIGGTLTAWTGLGVGAEALGAAISVGSTALETAGDIQATGKKREEQESDIMSERRGGAAAAQQETVVGRSN
jgi:hypothetical protein